jgi:solute carrier family 25 (mitochondrial carnitine/acylcarnitine transporter), member 20/29
MSVTPDPLDTAKCHIQKGSGSTSIVGTLRSIYAIGGMKSLYRGFGASILRAIPSAAATFTVYEFTIKYLDGREKE